MNPFAAVCAQGSVGLAGGETRRRLGVGGAERRDAEDAPCLQQPAGQRTQNSQSPRHSEGQVKGQGGGAGRWRSTLFPESFSKFIDYFQLIPKKKN